MRRAIELAARGLGAHQPQPRRRLRRARRGGRGRRGGLARSAPAARTPRCARSRAAGAAARGGTAVVTLEPCNHTGRTGPCAHALIDAGVARVVVAVADPTPTRPAAPRRCARPASRSSTGLLAGEAEGGNVAWLTAVRRGRPYVIWKYAATLDGRVAAADGTSRWISSPESPRRRARAARRVDAIIAGVGHRPRRRPAADRARRRRQPRRDQPLRVVVDTDGRTPAAAPGCRDGSPRRDAGSPPPPRSAADAQRPGRPHRAARRAAPPRPRAACCSKAARAWPARSCAPGSSTSSSATSRRCCSAPARRPRRHRGRHLADAVRLDIDRRAQRRPRRADLRRPARTTEEADVFTGIVEELGEVAGRRGPRRRVRLAAARARWSPPTREHGDSIAVNGVCLTVVDVDDGVFTADVMARDARPQLQPRRARRRLAGSTWSARGARRPARRPHRAGPRRRRRADRWRATPVRALGGARDLAARRARPLRRREGLDHRRRRLADRRRRSATTASPSA